MKANDALQALLVCNGRLDNCRLTPLVSSHCADTRRTHRIALLEKVVRGRNVAAPTSRFTSNSLLLVGRKTRRRLVLVKRGKRQIQTKYATKLAALPSCQ